MIAKTMKEFSDLTEVPYYQFRPVKFGYETVWTDDGDYILASTFVPKERGLIVYRVECYVTSFINDAQGNYMHLVPPQGSAWWVYQEGFSALSFPTDNDNDQTDRVNPSHLVLDCEEFLLFGGGQYANLVGSLDDPPNDATVVIRTTVYGFHIPGAVYERLRNQFNWISNTN